jgi:hypothetical protein
MTWQIAGSPYSGTVTVPAHSSIYLNTPVAANGPTTLILSIDGVQVASSTSDPTQCTTPPQPVPSPPPTGTGGNLPGLPNTGTGPDSAPPGDGRAAATLGALAVLGAAAVVAGGWLRRRRGRSA